MTLCNVCRIAVLTLVFSIGVKAQNGHIPSHANASYGATNRPIVQEKENKKINPALKVSNPSTYSCMSKLCTNEEVGQYYLDESRSQVVEFSSDQELQNCIKGAQDGQRLVIGIPENGGVITENNYEEVAKLVKEKNIKEIYYADCSYGVTESCSEHVAIEQTFEAVASADLNCYYMIVEEKAQITETYSEPQSDLIKPFMNFKEDFSENYEEKGEYKSDPIKPIKPSESIEPSEEPKHGIGALSPPPTGGGSSPHHGGGAGHPTPHHGGGASGGGGGALPPPPSRVSSGGMVSSGQMPFLMPPLDIGLDSQYPYIPNRKRIDLDVCIECRPIPKVAKKDNLPIFPFWNGFGKQPNVNLRLGINQRLFPYLNQFPYSPLLNNSYGTQILNPYQMPFNYNPLLTPDRRTFPNNTRIPLNNSPLNQQ